MASARGCKFTATEHVKKRYGQRCLDGPGLIEEVQTARTATKRQHEKIRQKCPAHYRIGRQVRRNSGNFVAWVSRHDTVFITEHRGDNCYRVITCWKMLDA